MVDLLPVDGSVVAAGRARRVVAPPYDALRPEQRDAMAAADPDSFLGVLPPGGADDDLDGRLRACRVALDRLLRTGAFQPWPAPSLAVLTLDDGHRTVTAVVGDIEVAAFQDGRVLPHERTRPDRVVQLARYLDVVGIASSPVAVAHRGDAGVAAALSTALDQVPDVAFVADDGVEVTVRVVGDPGRSQQLRGAIDAAGQLYVVDGHHRAAGVAVHAAGGPGRCDRVLSAVFDADQLRVLAFHRRLEGIELPPQGLAAWLRRRGLHPDRLDVATAADGPGTVSVTDGTGWWRVDLRERRRPGPVDSLDVRTVERELLDPLRQHASGNGAADGDVTDDPRVVPVAPTLGLDALVRPGSVGVALAAPPIEAILAVADAGAAMPAKTTYVTPKLRSGLLLAPR